AHAWSSVVGSWLDDAAGIRMCDNSRCNYRVSQVHTTGSNPATRARDVNGWRARSVMWRHDCILKPLAVIEEFICSIHRGAKSMTNASRVTMIGLLGFDVL